MKSVLLLLTLFSTHITTADTLAHLPARQEIFWGGYSDLKLEDKIRRAPPELIEYLRKDNQRQGWSNMPIAVDIPSDLLSDIRAAILEIPEKLRKKISASTVGIFFIEDLGGSAYTDYTFDKKGLPTSGFVVVDRAALNRKANEWATWKETSPFKLDSKTKLTASIESETNDNRKNALQYILLHEFGHILTIRSPLLPPWGNDWSKTKITPSMKFFNLSWKVEGGSLSSLYDSKWPPRKLIAYYRGDSQKLSGDSALSAYQSLLTTNFPTLYAATDPSDDFAESFANYVHVVLLKKPWKIRVASSSTWLEIGHCWGQVRCREKENIMENLAN